MPPDSSEIDAAIVAKLLADPALTAMMPDGVFIDAANQDSQRFVIVSLLAEDDVASFGRRAYENATYLVKAVALSTSGGNVKGAAARIDALLEDQPLVAPGYQWMTMHRDERVRYTEVDDADPSIRWQHRGGHYRVQMTAV